MQLILDDENEIKEYLNWKYGAKTEKSENKEYAVDSAKTQTSTPTSNGRNTLADVRQGAFELQTQKGKDFANAKLREMLKKYNAGNINELKPECRQNFMNDLKAEVANDAPQ